LRGNPAFLGKQFVAALVCSTWAFVFTYAMLWLINLVTRVKVDEVAEQSGLDVVLHGEEAYPLGI
jgi:Amt family ammonium transporter